MSKESEALLELAEPMNWPIHVSVELRQLTPGTQEAIRTVTARQIILALAIKAMAEEADKTIAAVDGDERYHYPPAQIQTNAPLALVQVEMEARLQEAKRIKDAGHAAAFPEEKSGTRRPFCGDCDGVGWVEGGKALQTDCRRCDGTGLEPEEK